MNEIARQAKEAMSRRGSTGRQAWIDAERLIARMKRKRSRMFQRTLKMVQKSTYGKCQENSTGTAFEFTPTKIGTMYRALIEAEYLFTMGISKDDPYLREIPRARFVCILMGLTRLRNEIKKGKVKVVGEE